MFMYVCHMTNEEKIDEKSEVRPPNNRPPIHLSFYNFPDLYKFSELESKKRGLTIQAFIRNLIAEEKNKLSK